MGGKGWKGLVFHPAERIIQIALLRGKEEEEEEEGGAAPSLSALPRKTVSKVGKEMRLIPMRWRERRRRRRRLSISTVPPPTTSSPRLISNFPGGGWPPPQPGFDGLKEGVWNSLEVSPISPPGEKGNLGEGDLPGDL